MSGSFIPTSHIYVGMFKRPAHVYTPRRCPQLTTPKGVHGSSRVDGQLQETTETTRFLSTVHGMELQPISVGT